jgi:uncharacterized protein with PQ loop repeat
LAALPDLIAMLRRRSSAGMNPKMAAIMGAFQILWIWYGLVIVSRPVLEHSRVQRPPARLRALVSGIRRRATSPDDAHA